MTAHDAIQWYIAHSEANAICDGAKFVSALRDLCPSEKRFISISTFLISNPHTWNQLSTMDTMSSTTKYSIANHVASHLANELGLSGEIIDQYLFELLCGLRWFSAENGVDSSDWRTALSIDHYSGTIRIAKEFIRQSKHEINTGLRIIKQLEEASFPEAYYVIGSIYGILKHLLLPDHIFLTADTFDERIQIFAEQEINWLKKAALADYSPAQYSLGKTLEYHYYNRSGLGILKNILYGDLEEGLSWMRKAAEKGYAEACIHLAGTSGFDAQRYLKLAIDNGSKEAEVELAIRYVNSKNDADKAHGVAMLEKLLPMLIDNNTSYKASYTLADYYYNIIQHDRAIVYYKHAIAAVDIDNSAHWSPIWVAVGHLHSIMEAHDFLLFVDSLSMQCTKNAIYAAMGQSFSQGMSWCAKDEETACKWFMKAANWTGPNSDRNFLYCLDQAARIHMQQGDINGALNLLLKAAKAGSTNAKVTLGDIYARGTGVERNVITAIEYYTDAANANQRSIGVGSDAAEKLGYLYFNGDGVARDMDKAIKWMKLANTNEAAHFLGWCYETGTGVSKNLAQALTYYEAAAGNCDRNSQFDAGRFYLYGIGVEQDYSKAVEYLKRASEWGHLRAQTDLAWCYENGKGVETNFERAVELYEKAAAGGEITAKGNLGWCYIYGRGVSVDYDKAIPLLIDAANSGNAHSQCELGVCYEYGRGVEPSPALAAYWYKQSADNGYAYAKTSYGRCLYNGFGVSVDYDKAFRFFTEAAEAGNVDGMIWLGACYERSHGVEQNPSLAASWYKKAADNGNALAKANYGGCLYNGFGVSVDYDKAFHFFSEAAEAGNAHGMNWLGVCYGLGRGVVQNLSLAASWYKKAADNGDINALRNVGLCYEFGRGVEKNLAIAKEYYGKAKELGHPSIDEDIQRVLQSLA